MRLFIPALVVLAVASSLMAQAPATQPTTKPVNKVVFVVDGSGSMLGVMGEVRAQVVEAVAAMPADRQFAVYLDTPKGITRYPKAGFARPSDEGSQEVADLLRGFAAQGNGRTEGVIIAACKARPDVLWLVSDGSIDDNKPEAIARIIAAAKFNNVRINTTLSMAVGPPAGSVASSGERTLFKLAKETGGTCYDRKGKPIEELAAEPEKKTYKPSGKKSVFTEN